ncbi:hypothetical protein GQ600_97 [Phytophthora cactorum]|nr:hypothetical protein GQ600_97 [Phytophthora cactorum]
MLDVKRVGADLTPAEQDEAIADLAFFLDEFGSTGAVRAKLEEQESDIKRLHDQIRRLLTHQNDLREEGGHNRSSSNTSTHPGEGVDETMKDLDFFITTFGTTREVREKLERQIIKIVGLRRTVRWLKEHQQARINSKESSGVELECKKYRYDPTEERSRESEKPSEIFKRDDTEEGDDVVEKVAACPKTDQTEVVKTVHTNEKHFDKERVQASSALVGDAEIREHVDFELLLEANKVYSGLSPSASSGDGQHSHLELAGKNAGNGIAMPQVKAQSILAALVQNHLLDRTPQLERGRPVVASRNAASTPLRMDGATPTAVIIAARLKDAPKEQSRGTCAVCMEAARSANLAAVRNSVCLRVKGFATNMLESMVFKSSRSARLKAAITCAKSWVVAKGIANIQLKLAPARTPYLSIK